MRVTLDGVICSREAEADDGAEEEGGESQDVEGVWSSDEEFACF